MILPQGFGERRGTERAFPGQGINVGLGNDGGGEVIPTLPQIAATPPPFLSEMTTKTYRGRRRA